MRVVGKRAMSATHKSFRHRSSISGGKTLECTYPGGAGSWNGDGIIS